MNNFVLIILDGVGIGEFPDADKYGDKGSNTLGNIANYMGGLDLPNLQKMGLGNIKKMFGYGSVGKPMASFGKMTEESTGKDSTSGHWEIGGYIVDFEFPTYPNGFPDEVMEEFLMQNNLEGFLANKPASGTRYY